jgi:TolB-like protein
MSVRRALGALACLAIASVAEAQCPDGSPPPCRTQTVASATRRLAPPPIDDRTWIVVPFDNLARAQEVDWLRTAAVNLLYLDMSRWRDIRVIDDERVADLLRETPEVGSAQAAMSLNAGLAVAKRAGAGRLVMGDLLKLGTRTQITAKVFNVRTGQRIRSVSEATSVQDSVMPLFGRLAQRILNVAPPEGANVGALGTSSVSAYQEYLTGVQALNRFDLAEARTRLERAIELDSTFALAHYKLAVTFGWAAPGDPAQRRHAEAASRLMVGLPARERSLITGQLNQTANNWTDACQVYAGMLRSDSLDVEALYGLGECLFHDPTVAAVDNDTTRLRFRANWQQSIRAFERVLLLDPQYHLAYQHIVDALTADRHNNANYCAPGGGRCRQFTGYLIRVGDSVTATPVDPRVDTAALRLQAQEYLRTQSRRRNLAAAAEIAEAWVRAAPGEPRAHGALAFVFLLQGHIARADEENRAAGNPVTPIERLRHAFQRMEIAHKLGRGSDAVRLYDSVRASPERVPGAQFRLGNAIAGYAPPFGRLDEFDSLMAVNLGSGNAPPLVLPFQRRAIRAVIGGPIHDSLPALELQLFDMTRTNRGVAAATSTIAATLSYALRMPRATWPALDTAMRDPRLRPAAALSRGDTAALRRAAMVLDSLMRVNAAGGGGEVDQGLIATESFLALGDSVAALRTVRFVVDSAALRAVYFPAQSQGFTAAAFMPRLMLLRADLAAAAGQRDEARTWYGRFIDLWSTATADLQPVVARARAARAALGSG